jgi:DNA-binding NarL/FixJ family response regulator
LKNILSPRQLEVLTLIAEGETVRGAAYKLGISQKVARNYKRAAVIRLGGKSITHAAVKAAALGLIKVDIDDIEKVHH